MKGYWELIVYNNFSAAHALRGYQGKCENVHGHNFKVSVAVKGSKLQPNIEFLIDFGILKKCLANIIGHLDHQDLNHTPPFDLLNPTSENIAQYIFYEMQVELRKYNLPPELQISVSKVTVSENENQEASWIEIEPKSI